MPCTPAVDCDPREALRRWLPGRGALLVGVSGGGDSLALMALVAEEAPGRALVVHVAHGLRPEAEDEPRLVADFAARAGLEFALACARPTPADPARTETAARRRRMAAFETLARRRSAGIVLLAHHGDDEDETLLLRLQRGHRGARALAGIPVARRLAIDGPLLLRPFVAGPQPVRRRQLEPIVRARGWSPIDDASNRDARIPRVAVRQLLARSDAGFRAALGALRRQARGRLQALVSDAVALASSQLEAEGLGTRLSLGGWRAARGDEGRAELLRFTALALARPRRIDPRATLLARLEALVRAGAGTLALPAEPRPLQVRVSARGLHFIDEPPAGGDVPAALATALLRQSAWP